MMLTVACNLLVYEPGSRLQCLQLVRICPYLYGLYIHAMYGYMRTTLYYTELRVRPRLCGVSAAAAVCIYICVSGDGMQEPPNESDVSASTLIIVNVFGSYAFYMFSCTVFDGKPF